MAGVNATLAAIRRVVHALRGWPRPEWGMYRSDDPGARVRSRPERGLRHRNAGKSILRYANYECEADSGMPQQCFLHDLRK